MSPTPKVRFWGLLTGWEQQALQDFGTMSRLPANAHLHTGHAVMLDGWAKVWLDGTLIRIYGPGDIVWLPTDSPLGDGSTSVIMATPATVLRLPASRLGTFMHRYSGVSFALAMSMATQLADGDLRTLGSQHAAKARIARVLVSLINPDDRSCQMPDGWLAPPLPLTRAEIGMLAGTSIATLTRVLHPWRKAGIIAAGGYRLLKVSTDHFEALARAQTEVHLPGDGPT
jgi:CRP-like cAMP-binding protein